MDLGLLIEKLSLPGAYAHAHPTSSVEVLETHASVVFLAGEYAYKIKKPVNFGFLDFSTLELRHADCCAEVRLNRRLARAVYLGVVPIVKRDDGLSVEQAGDVVEWAVKMQRLPDETSFLALLQEGRLGEGEVSSLAERLALFHASAVRGPEVAALGSFAVVQQNARENFEQAAPEVGVTVSSPVFQALRSLTDEACARLAPLIEQRAQRGVPCDGHGDLRLDHVYVTPSIETEKIEVIIIDCLEFNERYRSADPVCDMSFLVMDLLFHGRGDLARAFSSAYFRFSEDAEGAALLPFYVAYRSVVRAKVRGMELRDPGVVGDRRTTLLCKARSHFLLALGTLEGARRRPFLLLIGGLPGTGKSTLAGELARVAGFEVIRSDVVRKELAGGAAAATERASWQAGMYSPHRTAQTYAECWKRTESLLFLGKRVIVDANFGAEAQRVAFLRASRAMSVPVVWLVCTTSPALARERLAARIGDASDADWAIHEMARQSWEPEGDPISAVRELVETDRGRDESLAHALLVLEHYGAWESTQ